MVEDAAVRVFLGVSIDLFDAIYRQVADAYAQRRLLQASLSLFGEPLTLREPRTMFVSLKDLDVSVTRTYPVERFEIFDTRYLDHMRGRILPIEPKQDQGFGAEIRILLTEARYEVDMKSGSVYRLLCEGIVSGKGKPWTGTHVDVEFSQYEPKSELGGPPEETAFGQFKYFPGRPDEVDSSTYCCFTLKHVAEDVRELLVPNLTQGVTTQVVLIVNLAVEEAELLRASDEVFGDVREYRIAVIRRLINNP